MWAFAVGCSYTLHSCMYKSIQCVLISVYGCVILNNGPVPNLDEPRRKTKTKIANELDVKHEGISKPKKSVVYYLNNICTLGGIFSHPCKHLQQLKFVLVLNYKRKGRGRILTPMKPRNIMFSSLIFNQFNRIYNCDGHVIISQYYYSYAICQNIFKI